MKNLFKKKNVKLKTNVRAFLIVGFVICLLILVYFIGNYGKFNVVTLNATQNSFVISNGLMISTPKTNLIMVDDITYNNEDYKIQKISVELLYKGKTTKSLETVEYTNLASLSLKECLKNVKISTNNLLKSDLLESINNNLYLKINILTNDNRSIGEEINLQKTKESNTKLLYY